MKIVSASASIIAATLVLTLVACNTSTSPSTSSLYNDSTVTADIANTSGDAIATSVDMMLGDESAASMPSASQPAATVGNSLSYTRTRTCYDSTGTVVPGCSPMSSVRKVITHVSLDGSRSESLSVTGGPTRVWSGAVHRVADDTVNRIFNTANPPVETSRVHLAVGTAHDSTSFQGDTVSRSEDEAAHDTFNVTWNLPHSTNPFPVAGSIMRVDSVHVTFTKGSTTETRDVVRTVEVDFPPDAQGNVTLKINGKTCTLNLVTHAVANCH